jgi:hypothetical protein
MKTEAEIELEEMLVGAQREEENLRDYLTEIASIIYMESPIEYQDMWLERMITLGYYKPAEDIA